MRIIRVLVIVATAALGGLVVGQSTWPPQTNEDLRAAVSACIAISIHGNCPSHQCV